MSASRRRGGLYGGYDDMISGGECCSIIGVHSCFGDVVLAVSRCRGTFAPYTQYVIHIKVCFMLSQHRVSTATT